MTFVPPPPSLAQLAATRDQRARRAALLAARTAVPSLEHILDRPDIRGAVAAAYRARGESGAAHAVDVALWQITRGRARNREEAAALRAWITAARAVALEDVREAVEAGYLAYRPVSDESAAAIEAAWHAARDAYIAGREGNDLEAV